MVWFLKISKFYNNYINVFYNWYLNKLYTVWRQLDQTVKSQINIKYAVISFDLTKKIYYYLLLNYTYWRREQNDAKWIHFVFLIQPNKSFCSFTFIKWIILFIYIYKMNYFFRFFKIFFGILFLFWIFGYFWGMGMEIFRYLCMVLGILSKYVIIFGNVTWRNIFIIARRKKWCEYACFPIQIR